MGGRRNRQVSVNRAIAFESLKLHQVPRCTGQPDQGRDGQARYCTNQLLTQEAIRADVRYQHGGVSNQHGGVFNIRKMRKPCSVNGKPAAGGGVVKRRDRGRLPYWRWPGCPGCVGCRDGRPQAHAPGPARFPQTAGRLPKSVRRRSGSWPNWNGGGG